MKPASFLIKYSSTLVAYQYTSASSETCIKRNYFHLGKQRQYSDNSDNTGEVGEAFKNVDDAIGWLWNIFFIAQKAAARRI
ncbi:ATP-dependent (S)-NAD(P)H-hydrate dehydratase [Dirofilaria immitis]